MYSLDEQIDIPNALFMGRQTIHIQYASRRRASEDEELWFRFGDEEQYALDNVNIVKAWDPFTHQYYRHRASHLLMRASKQWRFRSEITIYFNQFIEIRV